MSLVVRARRALHHPKILRVGKKYKKLITPLLIIAGMRSRQGAQPYEPSKRSIIIVSHEASATGAPILALNICQEMNKSANVIVILIRGGALRQEFQNASTKVIQPRFGLFLKESLRHELKKVCGKYLPHYAIVNSVVSAGTVQPLRSIGIPTITLIHEFSAYIRPLELIDNISIWSSKIIFSSPLTKNDMLKKCPHLKEAQIEVLPQGPCKRPLEQKHPNHTRKSKTDEAWQFLKDIDKHSLLILGAGEIQPRKGVDLFISVADQIKQLYRKKSIFFVWIGAGYDPEFDFNVSLWLDDQIHRSELSHCLRILNHSTAYGDLLKRTNLFLMTSRLDPLPNVAIDAMFEGKPMLCFEKACGMANLLMQDKELGNSLVSPYLNVANMANKAVRLIEDEEKYQKIAKISRMRAKEWFDMPKYINTLEKLGKETIQDEEDLNKELDYALREQTLKSELAFNKNQFKNRNAVKHYLLKWRCEVWPQKPFPGFHPGIYRDLAMAGVVTGDPLVHYLQANRPVGPWNTTLITPSNNVLNGLENPKTAIHIHAHYPEILDKILESIQYNRLKPDLFISISDKNISERVKDLVNKSDLKLKLLIEVPNRGRDIGPLLTDLGKLLDKDYIAHGHIHTKKSVLIDQKLGDQWMRFLLANLLGTPTVAMADRIVSALVSEDNLGLVFPDDPTCVGWNGNHKIAKQLAQRLGVNQLPRSFNFPVGTMYWAKKGALSTLYELGLNYEDYPSEPIGYDGTILHAIERLLPLIVKQNGFEHQVTYVPGITR